VKRGPGQLTLENLTRVVLGKVLPKPPEYRVSTVWDDNNLPDGAKAYAGKDVEAGVQIMKTFATMQDLTKRLF